MIRFLNITFLLRIINDSRSRSGFVAHFNFPINFDIIDARSRKIVPKKVSGLKGLKKSRPAKQPK